MSESSDRESQRQASWRRRYGIGAAGVALAVALPLSGLFPDDQPEIGRMAAIAVLMAVWWVFEVVPIAVTSLFPIVLMPALGIASLKAVTANYGKPTIFLFLGGFVLALGLQRSGLHRRIALHIVNRVGSHPARLVLGFMLACALLSMWISNTASVMVMMPIALSVLDEAIEAGTDKKAVAVAGTAVMLGIAYAADMGGMATPVGTPPNLVLIEMQSELFPDAPAISFAQWMAMGLPIAAIFLSVGWLIMTRFVFRLPRTPMFGGSQAIRTAIDKLGPVRRDEWLAGGVFAAIAALWMTGSGLQLGDSFRIPGWRDIDALAQLGDGAVAILGAIVLFMIPSADHKGEALMNWDTATRLPWGILLLFGGGFALAAGFQSSGLSETIGQAVAGLKGVPIILIVLIVCTVLTFLTELTSNTATTNLVLPILAQAAVALAVDPRFLMIPATLSASCAFMMPVASPTQAIVFSSGYITIKQMVRAGIWFNLLGIILVTVIFMTLGGPAMGVDADTVPDWAH
ncbi:MAG: SLC13 family permease [Proteobacteria bacterium]|nr:SLC13 family permease [Pseudomonadota bacterium]